ncbi:hypothetical protein Ddye_001409 [Dipteronia dyeriana]|uniref:hAT-like transposase RNase-H fold domain-containing protein n=1 Tax=Dipteronia dyeriana TaxID=168575 RepID=A0AAD9XNU8_9ROSI|nr:hypothetical protein Ddye_001409 [Dipteronia dyeriana]
MEEEDGHYVNYFKESDNGKKWIGPPLLNDWENVNGLDKTNNLLIIAVVLDPRYKFGYVKWRLDAFYGVTQSHSILSSLKEVLVELYEYYVTQYGSVGVRSNDDVSSFGSGMPETFYEKEKFREDSLWDQKQQEEDVSMGKSEDLKWKKDMMTF